MTTQGCEEIRFLLQADVDGQLDVAGSATVAAHVADCPDCAALQVELAGLSAALREHLPYHAAPQRLQAAVKAAMAASRPAPASAPAQRRWQRPNWSGLSLGAGMAMAAAVALVMVLPQGGVMSGGMSDSVVANHIRALQPGHLTDVISTDRHTVKPWFDGRLDYAPPVKDLAAAGFPLVGGRLDYLGGREVAALAYRRAQHVIDMYVWPSTGPIGAPPGGGERNGYNYLHWTQDGMTVWVVSDLEATELETFADLWRAAH